jgi:glutathione S-transferase
MLLYPKLTTITNLAPALHSFPSIGYICFGMDCDDTVAKEKFNELLDTHFKTLTDWFLKDTKFVFSDTPTIADLSIAMPLTFIKARTNFWEAVPDKVKDYYEAVKEAFSHTAEEFAMLDQMCSTCEHPGAKLELE